MKEENKKRKTKNKKKTKSPEVQPVNQQKARGDRARSGEEKRVNDDAHSHHHGPQLVFFCHVYADC